MATSRKDKLQKEIDEILDSPFIVEFKEVDEYMFILHKQEHEYIKLVKKISKDLKNNKRVLKKIQGGIESLQNLKNGKINKRDKDIENLKLELEKLL